MVLEKNNLECLLLSKKETQPDTACLLTEVHSRSELKHATFWTHSPALCLTPGALTTGWYFSCHLGREGAAASAIAT